MTQLNCLLNVQVPDLQQRKCTIMFELSCNLERILEFFTQELPHIFLEGSEMNLIRLCELIIFVLNHTTSSADAQYFDRCGCYFNASFLLFVL
jgi:Kip1 ubiquitination-promoting complex protein 1